MTVQGAIMGRCRYELVVEINRLVDRSERAVANEHAATPPIATPLHSALGRAVLAWPRDPVPPFIPGEP